MTGHDNPSHDASAVAARIAQARERLAAPAGRAQETRATPADRGFASGPVLLVDGNDRGFASQADF